jgi:hypothetical protein
MFDRVKLISVDRRRDKSNTRLTGKVGWLTGTVRLAGQSRPMPRLRPQLPATIHLTPALHKHINLLTPRSNPISLTATTHHGADQGPQRARAFPRPQQVRNFPTRGVGLDRASHQCTKHLRIRRTAADPEHPEPAEFGGVCLVSDASGDLRLGNMG